MAGYLNNFFWLFLTYLLAPCFYFLIAFARRSRAGKKNARLKILVIQTAKIGDLVCTTPVFREIKNAFPGSYLAALVTSQTKDILLNNPRIDEVISINDYRGIPDKFKLFNKLRKEKYDWVFATLPGSFNNIIAFWSLVPNRATTTHKYSGELAHLLSIFNNYRLEYKRGKPLMAHYLDLLKFILPPSREKAGGFIGIENVSGSKEIFIKTEEEKKAADFLGAHNLDGGDLLIGISCTSGVKIKEWEPVKFAALADKLIEEKNAKIIFIGSAVDCAHLQEVQKMMLAKAINACGVFKLHELPALLKKLKLFISVDNGPLHMADALGVPVADIVGPINTDELYPLGPRSRLIQKDLDCRPCSFMFQPPPFCKEKHLKCLKDISVQEVFDVSSEILGIK